MCNKVITPCYGKVKVSGSVALFRHIRIGMNDVAAMVAYYDRVLTCVGVDRTTPLNTSARRVLTARY